jgi:hypothetical protein
MLIKKNQPFNTAGWVQLLFVSDKHLELCEQKLIFGCRINWCT